MCKNTKRQYWDVVLVKLSALFPVFMGKTGYGIVIGVYNVFLGNRAALH